MEIIVFPVNINKEKYSLIVILLLWKILSSFEKENINIQMFLTRKYIG